jgi:hypothetical protein
MISVEGSPNEEKNRDNSPTPKFRVGRQDEAAWICCALGLALTVDVLHLQWRLQGPLWDTDPNPIRGQGWPTG